MAEILAICLDISLVIGYLYVAYTDFTRWKITNSAVFFLLLCGVAAHLNSGAHMLPTALFAGALLFVITFPFWLARVTGAGDVKLVAVTGLVVGLDRLLELAVLMLAFSLVVLLAITYGRYILFIPAALNRRLTDILQSGKVPYGVPVSLAAMSVLSTRLIAEL